MQIKRLSIFLLLLAFCLSVTNSTLADTANIFRSRTVGFKITKPADWRFINRVKEKKIKLNLKEFNTSDLVRIYRYPGSHPENTKIIISSTFIRGRGLPVKKQAQYILNQLIKKHPEKYTLIEDVKILKIAGTTGASFKIENVSAMGGKIKPLIYHYLLIPNGKIIFKIAIYSPADRKGARESGNLVKKILKTIKING